MSLSVASRRRFQTNGSCPASTSVSTSRLQLPVRKQHSFIEPPPSKFTSQQRGYLSRGLSVGRSIENIRQKLYPSVLERPKGLAGHLSRQSTLTGSQESTPKFSPGISSTRLRDKSLVAWSSNSSLLKSSLDQENEQRLEAEPKKTTTKSSTDSSAKADKNRINLNIVLAQTIRATNEQEVIHSDIDSATESSELTKEPVPLSPSSNIPLSVSPALTVQRRPPLVRAMSAPVRGLDVIAANKRSQQKLRRRKIFTRTASSVATDGSSSLLGETGGNGSGQKKALSRARSVVAPDVITLVSLLSSEGSDSEREDNSAASTPPGTDKQPHGNNQRSPQRRAPLLRKTGKSVSFQDSYPPTFQLASKEYSHMIRRGSIAPLAARIRSNRPPTAPPVSIFLPEATSSKVNGIPVEQQTKPTTTTTSGLLPDEAKKENNNNAANCNVQQQQDYNYPLYVRSIKERECWKLYQKMCAKGVSVSVDTVLRGMLTPTEFRHFQKQREHEEAKALEEAEAEAAAAAEASDKETTTRKVPVTAIERLSESLLQNK